MKIKLFYAVLALSLTASCSTNPNVIFNPSVESNDTEGQLEILKIEFADTATIVHFDYYQYSRPENWFRFSSKSTLTGGSGKVYNVIGSSGITLDARERTDSTGLAVFTLTFEPLDKDEKTVNFSSDGYFQMSGIKLYSDKQPKSKKAIKCALKGEVVNRPYSHRLILSKLNEDLRTADVIYIPIRNGKFEYLLNCDYEEMYELVFLDEYQGGVWHRVNFFSEKGTISFTLYPMDESEQNQIKGGTLNTEYNIFNNSIREVAKLYDVLRPKYQQLEEEGRYSSPEAEAIYEKLRTANASESSKLYRELEQLRKEKKDITPEAQELRKESERISQKIDSVRLQYISEHQTLVGYTALLEELWAAIHYSDKEVDIAPLAEVYNTIYAPKYPNHPYTEQMQLLINSVGTIKVGGQYIDFEVPDLEGNLVKLSEQIQGKIAILHLWASWCGPCRQHGKELIPVYEAYKDKDFTIVGIARERNTTNAMKTAIEMDKYPWLNLVELNDKDKIWAKYGLGNAGGGEFLIDENGVILAVSPTAEDVEKILKERLE